MERQRCSRQEINPVRNAVCFSQTSFARLSEMMYESKVPAGGHLFWEGDPANHLYYVKQGRIHITKPNGEGKEFFLYLLQEGDFWGQPDSGQEAKQDFNAVAIEDSVVGMIQKRDLEIVLWQHGDLANEFIRWMGLMHRVIQTRFRDQMMYGKLGALCSTLIRLSNTFGRQRGDGLYIAEKVTNSQLADYIGSARESVNRMLGDLKRENAIALDGGHLVIKDMDYLRDICHCEQCPKEVCRI